MKKDMPCYCISIRKASRRLMALYDRALEPVQLTISQFAILRNTDRLGKCSLSDLSQKTDLERTSLVRMLRPLEERGLIEDVSGKKERSRILQLTPDGKSLLAQAMPLWQQAQEEIEEKAGRDSIEQVLAVLNRL